MTTTNRCRTTLKNELVGRKYSYFWSCTCFRKYFCWRGKIVFVFVLIDQLWPIRFLDWANIRIPQLFFSSTFNSNQSGVRPETLALDRLVVYYATSPSFFFRNNSWTAADIDMKLGIPLRTPILRRLMKKSDSGKTFLRYSQFCDVSSRHSGSKKRNARKFVKNTFLKEIARKMHTRYKLGSSTSCISRILEMFRFLPPKLHFFFK